MARVPYQSAHDIVEELLTTARDRGTLLLETEPDVPPGTFIQVGGKELVNFGTCGYLALEQDERVKRGAVEALEHYGVQFSVSRTYLTSDLNLELEAHLREMYAGHRAIVYSSTSLCHISVLPRLVRAGDTIVLDQQVHFSVQTAAQLAQQRGAGLEMIRHNRLEMLERTLQKCRPGQKVWYLIDGVYSMYGDVAPIAELTRMMAEYPALHLYIDDAHGMGWYGTHGAGYAFEEFGRKLDDRVVLITTLAKGFGTVGGIAVFPNEELHHKVRINGGPLMFSHPLPPPMLGAAIASAKIHLSGDLVRMQTELAENTRYCNDLLAQTDLPVLSDPRTPIYFIALGEPKVGYTLLRRLIDDGYYANIAIFPAVPAKNTGLRFTLTRHVDKSHIRSFVEAIDHHFPLALKEEGRTLAQVHAAFSRSIPGKTVTRSELKVTHARTIEAIHHDLWDAHLGELGVHDWEGLRFLENAFSGNADPEHNHDFHYYVIRDDRDRVVLATFFTCGLYKDDFLAHESVSRRIEEQRREDPHYLVSKTFAMGSMLTEGEHLYLDRSHPLWRAALSQLLDEVAQEQTRAGADALMLRDFPADDEELREFLLDKGFVKLNFPSSNVADGQTWHTTEEFLAGLTKRSRRHVRYEILKYADQYEVEVRDEITADEADHFYELYRSVHARNLGVNMFPYPREIMEKISAHPRWEFLVLRLRGNPRPVAVAWCYRSPKFYTFAILGMDYDYVLSHGAYRQSLYQALVRARQLGVEKVRMGVTAEVEKHKVGCRQIPTVAYFQTRDNFTLELIESMPIVEAR